MAYHLTGCDHDAFPAGEAKRLASKLELHDSPTHGNSLNSAEIELSVLAGQCLRRRGPGRGRGRGLDTRPRHWQWTG